MDGEGIARVIEALAGAPVLTAIGLFVVLLLLAPLILGWLDMRSQRKEHTGAMEKLSDSIFKLAEKVSDGVSEHRGELSRIGSQLDGQGQRLNELGAKLNDQKVDLTEIKSRLPR